MYRLVRPFAAARLDSCIVGSEKLLLADGSTLTADDVLSTVRSKRRVDFLHDNGFEPMLNPVVRAIRTRGRGVRIHFEDGRSVALTTGHVLPVARSRVPLGLDGAPLQFGFPVVEEPIVLAGHVRVGDELMDGRVRRVQPLGEVEAVRIWTAIPTWIHTAESLAIGTRWHEIALGVVEVYLDEYDEEQVASVILWPGRKAASDAGDWNELATGAWLNYRLAVNTSSFWEGLSCSRRWKPFQFQPIALPTQVRLAA